MTLKSDKKLLERNKNIEDEANKTKIEELTKKEANLKEEIVLLRRDFEKVINALRILKNIEKFDFFANKNFFELLI